MNPSTAIKIEKITLNIGAGKSTDRLEKGIKLFEMLTEGAKPVRTISKKRIAGWGIREGLPIGCKVTVRGEKAAKLLKQLLGGVDYKLDKKQFDNEGNVSFGIKEYTDIPAVEYTPEIGALGMQVCATLSRNGFRVKKRRLFKQKIGRKHRITQQEAVNFLVQQFNVKLKEE